MAFAIRWASLSPRPGQNQGRTGFPSTRAGRCRPCRCAGRPAASRAARSPRDSGPRARRVDREDRGSPRASTSRPSSSSSPSRRSASPSRITYLWCIRSGTPGIAAVGKGSDSTSSGFVCGGEGTGSRRDGRGCRRAGRRRRARRRLSAHRRRSPRADRAAGCRRSRSRACCCAAERKSASACAVSSAGWPPSVSVRISIWRPSRAARPCRRASPPGSRRAPAGSRRRRACGASARSPGRRDAEALREHGAERFTFMSPKPGSAASRSRRSAPSRASVQIRAASPSYSSTTKAARSCTRLAIEPGKRCTAGFSLKTARDPCLRAFSGRACRRAA